MLPTDLARFKIRHGEVIFRWLNENKKHDLERAERLLSIVGSHVGETRGDLDDAMKAETDSGRDYRIRRALGHLLTERTSFATSTELVPIDVRTFVFTQAAQLHPVDSAERVRILQDAANHFCVDVDAIESALYADLSQNQQVIETPQMTPAQLKQRYNVALVQSALLRCHHLKIHLPNPTAKRLRQFYRYLKFHRLLYRLDKDSNGLSFLLDGPSSVLYQSTRYGLLLAKFFPALLLCEEWSIEAMIQAKKRSPRGLLKLTHEMGLKSHYPDTGTWIAAEEQALINRLTDLASPWIISTDTRPISLGDQQVVVPDFVIEDPSSKQTLAVEILWRWRRKNLASRVRMLEKSDRKDILLLVCRAGQSMEDIPRSVQEQMISFVQVPNARSVLKKAKSYFSELG